jgi:hypothetical protein
MNRTRHGYLDLPDLPQHIEAAAEFTYAIWDQSFIKIGRSRRHPHERAKDLQTGNPRRLLLLAWTVDLTEAAAHRKLSRWRRKGEWFAASIPVLNELQSWTWVDVELFVDVVVAVSAETHTA